MKCDCKIEVKLTHNVQLVFNFYQCGFLRSLFLCVSAYPYPPSEQQHTCSRSWGNGGWGRRRWGRWHLWGWRGPSGCGGGGRVGSSGRQRAPPQPENEVCVRPVLEGRTGQRARQEPQVLHRQSSAQVRPVFLACS